MQVLSLVGLVAAGLAVVTATAAAPRVGGAQAGPSIVAIVGHWEEATIGRDIVVTADSRKWQPSSTPDLDAIAARLFSARHPGFAANAAPATAFPLAAIRTVDGFTGGTLRASFKLMAGETDRTAGLAFNLRPSGDYLFARYNTKDGNVAIWQYAKGVRTVLAHGEAHAQLPLDAWHELVVQVDQRTVTAFVGALRVSHTVGEPVSGRVGYWTKRDSVTAFKDFRR